MATFLESVRLVSPAVLAASPMRIASGRLWLLFSSALVVEHPLLLSLVSFAALAAVTVWVCGARVLWWSAAAGHIVSTLVVYVVIGVARVAASGAFSTDLNRLDYGVSAISAAWLGAVAAASWRARARSAVGRLCICVSCLAVAVFAYSVHPDRSALASEHVVAFLIGIVVAAPKLRATLAGATRRVLVRTPLARRLDPALAAVLSAATVLSAFVIAPAAFATLSSLIEEPSPSVAGCIRSWNHSANAPRANVRRDVTEARVTVVGRRTRRSCSVAFYSPRSELIVTGRWTDGGVRSWRPLPGRPATPTGMNAHVSAAARLHLIREPR